MPVISRFHGMAVRMYPDEHRWPHFHVKSGEGVARVSIHEPVTIKGPLGVPDQRRIVKWVRLHRAELLANWDRAERGEPVKAIDPLPE